MREKSYISSLFFRAQTTAYIVDKHTILKGGIKMNGVIIFVVCVMARVIMDVIDVQEGRV